MMWLHHGHGSEESHSFWIAQLDSPTVHVNDKFEETTAECTSNSFIKEPKANI